MLGTSHALMIRENMEYVGLKPYDKVTAFSGLFITNTQFNKDPDILVPLPEITEEKLRQQQSFQTAVANSKFSQCLNITGSNELKFLIVDLEGNLKPLREGASDIWSKLSWKRKAFYQPRHCCLAPKDTHWFVEGKVKEYMGTLINIYKLSGFKTVYISSVLERIYKEGHLVNAEIYIALINHFIYRYIAKLKMEPVLNKFNIPIDFVFINVGSQFYKAENKEALFSEKGRAERRLVHRNKPTWKKLMNLYLKTIRKN